MKYDSQTLQIIGLFEKITRAKLKDIVMQDDKYIFIVEEGEYTKALGKDLKNLKKLNTMLGSKIKIVEFKKDVQNFIKNLIYPLKPDSIEIMDDIAAIKSQDTKTKGLLIGSRAKNLRFYESVVQNYFKEIKEIKVI